jgi:Zn-dependent protease with chaperone function
MDFFAAQDRARRASRWLLLWFSLAVATSIGVVYLAVALPLAGEGYALWQPGLFFLVAFAVGGVILGGSAYKVAALAAGGGAAVAASLGGRLVPRATTDPAERRLVNLADEMAVAAGIPAPPVYVLDGETGINAFAAGARPQEAVVAVTRGALDKLSRDELQGVIAHEFSHILNGDMRLNLRLIGVLHGLFMLATGGRLLLRSGGGRSTSNKNRGGIVMLGVALVVAGYVGVLAGKLIRAAVSRQREYLADAAAVQFTRNPAGVAGALRKIAGESTTLANPRADEVSHMLFDAGSAFAGWLATHPPLAERIRRVEGGQLTAAVPPAPTFAEPVTETFATGFAAQIGAPLAAQLDAAHALIETLPDPLRRMVATPPGARAAVLALLLSRNADQRARQLDALAGQAGNALAAEVDAALPAGFSAGLRLPLIELALGALRELLPAAREDLLAAADGLARADGRVTLTEYILLRLLRDALAPRVPPPFLVMPGELGKHCARLLSLVAHAGQRDEAAVAAAFARGAAQAPVDGLDLLPLAEMRTEALDRALEGLSSAAPAYRRRLVTALAATAWHDDRLAPAEAELLAVVCGALDCPVPLAPPAAAKVGADGTAPGFAVGLATSGQTADAALASADRLPMQALILANLIPVFGVLFFRWDALTLLLTYWLENIVIGVYTYVRMARVGGWRTLFAPGLFFLFHYGFFCAGHGMVLMGIGAMTGLEIDTAPYIGSEEWFGPLIVFQELFGILLWIADERPGMILALLGFFISHGISTIVHQFIGNEDTGRDVDAIMFDPYRRIVILHVAIIAGMFVVILSGGASAAPVLLLVAAGKIALDLHLHRAAHRARLPGVLP